MAFLKQSLQMYGMLQKCDICLCIRILGIQTTIPKTGRETPGPGQCWEVVWSSINWLLLLHKV